MYKVYEYCVVNEFWVIFHNSICSLIELWAVNIPRTLAIKQITYMLGMPSFKHHSVQCGCKLMTLESVDCVRTKVFRAIPTCRRLCILFILISVDVVDTYRVSVCVCVCVSTSYFEVVDRLQRILPKSLALGLYLVYNI